MRKLNTKILLSTPKFQYSQINKINVTHPGVQQVFVIAVTVFKAKDLPKCISNKMSKSTHSVLENNYSVWVASMCLSFLPFQLLPQFFSWKCQKGTKQP